MKKFTESINYVTTNILPLNSELVFIKEGNTQVGSLIIVYNENSASILSVHILEEHRGKGYGKQIVKDAIERCKEKKYSLIELNIETTNIANNLYKSLGFVQEGVLDGFNHYKLKLS
jgi:ribosomal protein S18 acetylase RimI-like enzyme